MSQADLWVERDLRIEQPWVADLPWPNANWTAAPLGYRPVEYEESLAIVPTYSPGLPLLMAGAKSVFGHGALFWIVPLSGAVLVLATYGIGRRLGAPLRRCGGGVVRGHESDRALHAHAGDERRTGSRRLGRRVLFQRACRHHAGGAVRRRERDRHPDSPEPRTAGGDLRDLAVAARSA